MIIFTGECRNDWKQQVMVVRYLPSVPEGEDNIETSVYDFQEKIPVGTLPGLELTMSEVLKE